jgi:hypothetical protein
MGENSLSDSGWHLLCHQKLHNLDHLHKVDRYLQAIPAVIIGNIEVYVGNKN